MRTCGAGAINYDQKEEFITKEYGAIVVATGYNQIKPVKFDEYAVFTEQGCCYFLRV